MTWMNSAKRIVVGISGASGAEYAVRVIELLSQRGVEVHVAVSDLGRRLLAEECGMTTLDVDSLARAGDSAMVHLYSGRDMGAIIASGSFSHDGMIIIPCSSNTLGALASGITMSLVQRAAAVTLKEGRPLILAHRESPLSQIDISNMDRMARAGATIAPLSPGFYMNPTSVDDLIDFMAGRMLDLLGVEHELPVRWDG